MAAQAVGHLAAPSSPAHSVQAGTGGRLVLTAAEVPASPHPSPAGGLEMSERLAHCKTSWVVVLGLVQGQVCFQPCPGDSFEMPRRRHGRGAEEDIST